MLRALIVGASGILAPAAAALVLRNFHVTGISRNNVGMPTGVHPLVVDAKNLPALTYAVNGHSWSTAIVYMPAVEEGTLALLRSIVTGHLVEVRVAADADPVHGAFEVPSDTLQLGWHEAPPGAARWHTPDEVSAAALEVLSDSRGRILGAVRPWEHRP